MVKFRKRDLLTGKGAVMMRLIVISLENFGFNLGCEVFDRLLMAIHADQKYKWPPPIAR